MSDSAEDRVHAATPARREQARRDGDVTKSYELAAAIQMIGAIVVAFLLFGQIGQWVRSWTTQSWSEAGAQVSVETTQITGQLQTIILASLSMLAPMLLLLMLIGVASHWFQTGPMFLTQKIAPDPTRLASGNWKRQIFSLSSIAFLIVGIPKALVAGLVLVASCWIHRSDFFALANFPVDTMVAKLFSLVLTVILYVASSLLVTSVVDYWLKYVSYQRRIRMSDQQLRDELRMQNGDPQVRAQQQRMSRVS